MEAFKEFESNEYANSEIDDISSEIEEEFESFAEREEVSARALENIKNRVFTIIIDKHLSDVFIDSLYEHDYVFNEEDEQEFILGLQELTRDEQLAALSIPQELRRVQFDALKQKGVSLQELPKALYEQAHTHGYTVGYHVSPFEIKPKTLDEESEWNIVGTELDDRDDRPMAYYSLDHENLYKKKRGNYIYMVRAQTGEDSDHKVDGSNNWGRAPLLSVISQMENLSDIEEQVDAVVEKLKKDHSS